VYGGDFRRRATELGIETGLTPVRAPRANAVAERVIGALRREGLDHVLPLDERHLRTILTAYVDYYNDHRPYRTLQLRTPRPQERPRAGPANPGPGTSVQSRPILGGLHHVYEYAA
jgi:transposase InsO family protein